jgi:hypothetical protein
MRIIYDGGLILLASYLPICRWQILSSGKKSEMKKTETDGWDSDVGDLSDATGAASRMT